MKPHWYDRDPVVIRRWVGIKILPASRRIARAYMRPYLKLKERKRRIKLEKAVEAIAMRCKDLEKTDFETSKLLFNLALFMLLAERDIQSMKIDALTHRNEWKRNLSLRVILLTLHELDLGSVTGKRLKPALENAGVQKHVQNEAFRIIRNARRTQERARKLLGTTRHGTIAHREPNALIQYDQIRSLDGAKVLKIVADFYEAAHDLYGFLPRLLEDSSGLAGLASQFIATRQSD